MGGTDREDALVSTLCSLHVVLRTRRGAFLSCADPPPGAPVCTHDGLWPVLIDDTTVLASPIILEDRPRIAEESPGDLFDGGEIDQLLILNTLLLTDEEKAEVRASDPRARELLDRTEALTRDQLMRLHAQVREV